MQFNAALPGLLKGIAWSVTVIVVICAALWYSQGMTFIVALFDLLKGVAWPVVALVIALRYRSDIRSLLPRLRKASPTSGLEFDPAEQQQKALTADPQKTPGELKKLPGMSRTPAMENVERQLHAALEAFPQADRIDLLIRELAEARLVAAFERIYNLIFGSQITLLRRLNENTNRKLHISEARTVFDQVKNIYPNFYQDSDFENWLDFLSQTNLVQINDGFVEMLDTGRDFLVYITAVGRRTENKPF